MCLLAVIFSKCYILEFKDCRELDTISQKHGEATKFIKKSIKLLIEILNKAKLLPLVYLDIDKAFEDNHSNDLATI